MTAVAIAVLVLGACALLLGRIRQDRRNSSLLPGAESSALGWRRYEASTSGLRPSAESVEAPKHGAEEWHVGDLVWIARLEGATAAVIASVTPRKLSLAMGSSRFAYERGFSPSDPSLYHTKQKALARIRGR